MAAIPMCVCAIVPQSSFNLKYILKLDSRSFVVSEEFGILTKFMVAEWSC